jgi:putative glutathione S-transferase
MPYVSKGTIYKTYADVPAIERDARYADGDNLQWVCVDGDCSFDARGVELVVGDRDRYHLYVAYACPFAHRPFLARGLLGLQDLVTVSMCHSQKNNDVGWHFDGEFRDDVYGKSSLAEVILHVAPDYTGKVTTPILLDKKDGVIVSMDSIKIMRLFNEVLGGPGHVDLFPEELRSEIDALNATIAADINSGVYRCAFATSQESYAAACSTLFETLHTLEARLSLHSDDEPFLFGRQPVESDLLLFATLLRFDDVYYSLFKTNTRAVRELPALTRAARAMMALPGVADTIDMPNAMDHYWRSDSFAAICNPSKFVPPSDHWRAFLLPLRD